MANEKRLIDANTLYEELSTLSMMVTGLRAGKGVLNEFMKQYRESVLRIVDEQPTVDAVEVVHGRWEPHYETFDEDKAVGVLGGEYQTGWQCSVCGRYEPSEEPYCNCGAKMDGGNEDD